MYNQKKNINLHSKRTPEPHNSMPSLVHPSYTSARSDPSSSSKMAAPVPPTPAPAVAELTPDEILNTSSEDILDRSAFDQILEMDDDDEREFSRSIVYSFFEQADSTLDKMEVAIAEEDLDQVSELGHFLKGSSATLGLTKVKDGCEKIQHFGAQKDESGTTDEPDKNKSIERSKKTLTEVKQDYKEVAKLLKRFYGDAATS